MYSGSGFIEKERDVALWLPFNFLEDGPLQELLKELSGFSYIAKEGPPPRHILETDVVVSHYLLGRKYFEINKDLTRLFPIFGPGIIEGVKNGRYCFGAIRQKRQKSSGDEIEKAVGEMEEKMAGMLVDKGFRPSNVYAVELRDMPNETLCRDYMRGDTSARLLLNRNFPPLYIERNGARLEKPVETDYIARHPFAQLFEEQERLDDKTRKVTRFNIRIPKMEIPCILKEHYRANIEQCYPGNRAKIIKDYGLV